MQVLEQEDLRTSSVAMAAGCCLGIGFGEKMLKTNLDFRLLIYRFILPMLLAFVLFVISQWIERPPAWGSEFGDAITRFLIWVYFSGNYWMLPVLSTNIQKQAMFLPENNPKIYKIKYVVYAVIYGILYGLVTNWIIHEFVLYLDDYRLALSVIHGSLFTFTMISQYKSLMADLGI